MLVTDPTYATRDVFGGDPFAILIGDESLVLPQVAHRFEATKARNRPALLEIGLPGPSEQRDLLSALGLPHPLSIMPLLVRKKLYAHQGQPYPTTGVFAVLLAAALEKDVCVAGIDLYRHPSGRMYVEEKLEEDRTIWPAKHSEQVDVHYLRRAANLLGDRLTVIGVAGQTVAGA